MDLPTKEWIENWQELRPNPTHIAQMAERADFPVKQLLSNRQAIAVAKLKHPRL
jgi:hypothetical protein